MVKKGYFKNLLIIIHDDCILMKHVQMTYNDQCNHIRLLFWLQSTTYIMYANKMLPKVIIQYKFVN